MLTIVKSLSSEADLLAKLRHSVDAVFEPAHSEATLFAAEFHLKRGSLNARSVEAREDHSRLASVYQLARLNESSSFVGDSLLRNGNLAVSAAGLHAGPNGKDPGTFGGLTSSLTTYLRASHLSKSRHGQCG